MKKVINIMALVIVMAAVAFGVFMLGAKYCSSETVTITSNIKPVTKTIEVKEIETKLIETTTWENVETENWD